MANRPGTSRLARLVLFCAIAGLLAGCAGLRLADETQGLPPAVNLESVPFHSQTEFHCGPAALATVLEHGGVDVGVDELADRVYTPGLQGSLQAEMTATARGMGRLAYRLPGEPGAVFAEVAAGRPVLVLENLGLESRPFWHYAVVVGYERDGNLVILRSGEEREQYVRAGRWLRRWDRAGRWALVLVEPGQWPADPDPQRWITAAADFEAVADPDDAALVWEQTVTRWPQVPLAWLGLGNVEFSRGNPDAAVRAYRRLLALDPDHVSARYNLAVALQRSGRPCDALPLLERLADHEVLGERAAERREQVGRDCQDQGHRTER
jgi:hypothetical protein